MKTEWSKEFPKEEGTYWCYGWHSTYGFNNNKPTLMCVHVHLDGNNKPMYIADGNFLYKSEGAKGLWTKAILPTLPKLEKE